MRITIDCNVLIAAGIKDGTCRAVLKNVVNNHSLYLTEDIMMKYLQVIRRSKFKDFYKTRETLIVLLSDVAIIVKGSSIDPKDVIYLQAANAAQADFLITGNIKDFPQGQYETVKIITPTQFQTSFLTTN